MSLFYPSSDDDYDELCELRTQFKELKQKYNALLDFAKFLQQKTIVQDAQIKELKKG